MAEFFGFLFFITLIFLIVGLIKPSFFTRIIKKDVSRKKIGLILGSALFIFLFLIGATTSPTKVAQSKPNEAIVAGNSDKNTEHQTSETTTAPTEQPIKEATNQNENSEPKVAQINTPKATEKPAVATSTPVVPQYTYYSVVSVVDGDTLKINMNGVTTTLRLIGIDTPETVDPRKPVQCFGREASNTAKELLSGKKVRIEKDSTQGELDKYGRLLAYIYREDGLFYNKYMVEQGYAHEYTYSLPYKYQTEFKLAQTHARENQLGLWSPNTCDGDTVSSLAPITATTTPTATSAGKYYTSSYYSSKYYYPEACPGWKGLSSQYLKGFDSLSELLSAYPSRTLSPQCQ